MPITKNYSGFEFQATSPNVEDIKHLHIFCDSLCFYLSSHWWGGRKPHLCCTWGSPLPLGPRHGYKIFSTVRDGAEVLWSWSWVTRRCSLHWITCRPVCMAPSCPEASDAMLGIQLYSLSCLQTPLSRRTSGGISKRPGWDPCCSEAHYCFFFPSSTSSQSGRSFFLPWGRKYVVFCPLDIQELCIYWKIFSSFTSSANYS